ncbi:interleukin-17 receptor C isoform X3 [Pezoporus wallicus]|uniref:interleukin-17 receptor C isoform X3 n=1 Tax=Pezoporus wallicus TaxID=35540 RepID=UPI00254EACCA|nr:interleukin-17 receptor C isoform X3 [Pezoporus wallicus]
MGVLVPLVLVLVVTGGLGAHRDTLACTQGLACRLLDPDVLCGMEPQGSHHGLALSRLRLEPALRCTGARACSPCLEARLRLAVPRGAAGPRIPAAGHGGDGDRGAPEHGDPSPQHNASGVLLLAAHTYTSSRCVAMEVWAPIGTALPGRTLHSGGFPAQGWVTFRCFEAPLGSELRVTAYTTTRGHRRLSQLQRVPDCSWPVAQSAVTQCQAPRLQVSPGPKEVVIEVQGAMPGHSYTLRLYHNQSHGTAGPGRVVTVSSNVSYSLPAEEVLPCLCLQVWLETQDPLRATLCPFSHDAKAWQQLWARSRLVLHTEAQALTCSLSSPCDLLAELIPCWQPAPTGPCQALPGLRHPAMGQGSQELGGLWPHPNLCVQVWSHGQVRLSQCLQDRALPGRPDDILLLERHGNTSLCVLERGACTPLASFTSTGLGHPGLLEQELRRDVAMGQCRQIWHHENSTAVTLWACPMHKYLRARWVLAWMGVMLGAACLLLLLLLKKENIKGWLKSLRVDYSSEAPLRGRRALLVHAVEPVAERAACALLAALRPLGLAVAAAPGGGSGAAAWGPLPWLHAQHHRALRGGDTIIILLSPAAVAAAHQWDADPSPSDVPTTAPCEAFAAALSCAVPELAAGNGRYVVARLEALVPLVPPVLRAAPAFALPSETKGFLRALAAPWWRGRWLEPYVAAVAGGLRRAVGE